DGALLYALLPAISRALRLVLSAVFMSAAFAMQAYSLHTEVFTFTAFLVAMHALVRRPTFLSLSAVGLLACATFFLKPLGPLTFAPAAVYLIASAPGNWLRRIFALLVGALVPIAYVTIDLFSSGSFTQFWQQVVVDNTKLWYDFSLESLALYGIATLLLP